VVRLHEAGLVGPDDVCTGIYDGINYLPGYEPRNTESLYQSIDEYFETDYGKRLIRKEFTFKPHGFIGFANEGMGIDEILDRQLVESLASYDIYLVVRNPLDRYIMAATAAYERKRYTKDFNEFMYGHFSGEGGHTMMHMTWKHQHELIGANHANLILSEDITNEGARLIEKLGSEVKQPKGFCMVGGEIQPPLTYKGPETEQQQRFMNTFEKDYSLWVSRFEQLFVPTGY
jgi:hypothetical protein